MFQMSVSYEGADAVVCFSREILSLAVVHGKKSGVKNTPLLDTIHYRHSFVERVLLLACGRCHDACWFGCQAKSSHGTAIHPCKVLAVSSLATH